MLWNGLTYKNRLNLLQKIFIELSQGVADNIEPSLSNSVPWSRYKEVCFTEPFPSISVPRYYPNYYSPSHSRFHWLLGRNILFLWFHLPIRDWTRGRLGWASSEIVKRPSTFWCHTRAGRLHWLQPLNLTLNLNVDFNSINIVIKRITLFVEKKLNS